MHTLSFPMLVTGLSSVQLVNSGPISLTPVAPMISRNFKLGSCPNGGRYTHDRQLMRFKCFKEHKWAAPSQVGYLRPKNPPITSSSKFRGRISCSKIFSILLTASSEYCSYVLSVHHSHKSFRCLLCFSNDSTLQEAAFSN